MDTLLSTGAIPAQDTGYDIDNSVKLEADNSEFFSRTPSSNSNRQTFTFSTWIKRTELGGVNAILEAFQDGSNFFIVGIQNSDELIVYNIDSGTDYGYKYTRLFRDTAAWYHIVFKSDTTNGTAANRWQVYVNGVEITTKSADYGTPPQNYNSNLNSTISHNIGKREDQGTFMSCYLAETHLVDGTALAPTAFGEYDDSGIWKPIEVDVTYGTNGFYLNYITASDMGNDKSGENNDWAENNIAAADQSTDTPTNNFATFNLLNPTYGASVISEGGTKAQGSGQNTFDNIQSTIAVTKGKWYCEMEPQVDSAARNTAFGVVNLDTASFSGDHYGAAGFWSAGFDDGRLAWHFYNGGGAGTETVNYGTGSGDTAGTIGMAFDLDNGTLKFYIRNTQLSISASSIPAGTYAFFGDVMGTASPYLNFNFGGYTVNSISSAESDANGYGTFEYAPPSGYYALCTKNLAQYG